MTRDYGHKKEQSLNLCSLLSKHRPRKGGQLTARKPGAQHPKPKDQPPPPHFRNFLCKCSYIYNSVLALTSRDQQEMRKDNSHNSESVQLPTPLHDLFIQCPFSYSNRALNLYTDRLGPLPRTTDLLYLLE